MSPIDIIAILCLIPAVIQGIREGLVQQVAGIFSLVFGVWAAYHFSSAASEWLSTYISAEGTILNIISFASILIIVILVLAAIAKALTGIIKLVMLGWLNRLLGAVFALVYTSLVLGLLIILFNSLNTELGLVGKETLDASIFYNPLKNFTYAAFPYLKELLML